MSGQLSLLSLFVALSTIYVVIARTGVCYNSVSVQQYRTTYVSVGFSESYSCGWWRRCRRTLYRSEPRTIDFTGYTSQFGCCAGYSGSTCQPVCNGGCQNGGVCTAPNRCTCTAGWTGTNCNTDIDECANSYCEQVCVNSRGFYSCSCNTGYRLNPDGRTCADIHECNEMTHQCQHNCINNAGSYTCSCMTGYTLSSDQYSCIGSVHISLSVSTRFSNSFSIVAEWSPPSWDTERLTTSYIVSCSNGTFATNATVLNSVNSGGTFQETINLFDLDSGSNTEYRCCIMVVTPNGNGPPSCTTFTPHTTMPPTTESSESAGSDFTSSESTGSDFTSSESTSSDSTSSESTGSDFTTSESTSSDFTSSESTGSDFTTSESAGSDFTSSESTGSDFMNSESTDPELTNSNALGSSTGSPSLQSVLQSSGFKIGIGVGGACVAAIVVAVAVVVACCACFHYRRRNRFKESATSVGFHSKAYRPRMDTVNIQREVNNELYQTNYTKASVSIDEENDEDEEAGNDSGWEYNEVTYKGAKAKVNAYEDAPQYHYVKY